jgi:4-amino-4-deoxy-L-arabinose transferase-like glycosyltransferase
VVVGVAARAWELGSVGLNHYDEGAYVFSALGISDPAQPLRLFPSQIEFSPPAYFGLVGLSYKALGHPSDLAAIAVNVVLGSITVLLVWWVGRSWFGPPTGIAAAAFLAFNEFHIALSRAALTDVCFTLFFLAGLTLMETALRRESVRFSVLAGVVIGLSWNTKYHGWLAMVIGALAFVVVQARRGLPRRSSWRLLLLLGMMGVVALLCYLPWAAFIQSHPGGYAQFATFQRRFISLAWWHNLVSQAEMQQYFEGPLSRCAPVAAVMAAAFVTGAVVERASRFLVVLTFAATTGYVLGSSGTALLMVLAAIPGAVKRPAFYSTWVFLCWLMLFFLATPLYRPYVRLGLPLIVATHLGAGLWIAGMFRESPGVGVRKTWMPAIALAVTVSLVCLVFRERNERSVWRPSRDLADAADAMTAIIPPGERVLVVGEPTLAFYLRLRRLSAVESLDNREAVVGLTSHAYIVMGLYGRQAAIHRDAVKVMGDQLRPLHVYPFRPNDLRLLDDLRPQQARDYLSKQNNMYDLTLFEFVPR